MEETKEQIIAALAAAGWNVSRMALGPTKWVAATKWYATLVGPCEAIIYLDDRLNLTANYQSEGGNVLDPLMVIDADASKVPAFLDEVNHRIDQSYARRLHLQFPEPAAAAV